MESLKIHNSLRTGAPVPFTPIEPGNISWYACGPTVYDKSHLGHARNYVSTDIIRRILMHYFDFRVKFVMNMTDVDDKVQCGCSRHGLHSYTDQSPRSSSKRGGSGCSSSRRKRRTPKKA